MVYMDGRDFDELAFQRERLRKVERVGRLERVAWFVGTAVVSCALWVAVAFLGGLFVGAAARVVDLLASAFEAGRSLL